MIGIYAFGFAHQVIHHMTLYFGAVIVQKIGDDVFLASFHQSLGDVLALVLAHGYCQLVRYRAVLDGFDQIGVMQHVAFEQDGMGDLKFVIS